MKVGIDIGGSHIAIGVVENEKIIEKIEKLWTKEDKQNIKESVVNYIVETVKELLKKYTIESIGIGLPGTQKNGVIISSGKLEIENFPIIKKLQEKINISIIDKQEEKTSTPIINKLQERMEMPIKIKNDAKCAAIAEDRYGYLKEYTRSLFISLGTGLGGAVLIDHQLLNTGENPGCEIGHMIIEKDGLECSCGNKGCWQQYASMKVLKNNLRKVLGLDDTVHGKQLVEIIKQKKFEEEKQQKVDKVIEEYVKNLSIGISNLINIFEPEVIAIGGSFKFFEDILLEKIKKEIIDKDLLFNKRENLNIVSAILGNDAGIIGATLI